MTETTATTVRAPVKPSLPEDMPRYILHDSKVWEAIRAGDFLGYVPRELPSQTPFMDWMGGKIGMDVWQQILAFFEWSYGEFKSETQVRLFYNRETRKWAAWAFPQRPTGMTTNEVSDHPDVGPQRAQFKDPWMLLGTVHHHCSSAAFQSGVDANNEESQEGLHITVGNISSQEYSTHGRVLLRKTQFDVDWSAWFEIPACVRELPRKLHKMILDYYLKQPPDKSVAFPEQWKKNCIKWEAPRVYGRGGAHMDLGGHTGGYTGATGGSAAEYLTRNASSLIGVSGDLRSQFTPNELEFMKEMLHLMVTEHYNHSQLDMVVASSGNEARLNAMTHADKQVLAKVEESATRLKVVSDRVDELFDKWDFETVISELSPTAVPEVK